jgi:hypothetical protein
MMVYWYSLRRNSRFSPYGVKSTSTGLHGYLCNEYW